MKKRVDLLGKVGVGMLTVLIGATTVSAQMMRPGEGPHGGGEKEHGKMERPMGHPTMPGMSGMKGGMFFSMEGLKGGLGLNDEQAKKLHDLFIDYRKGSIQKRAALEVVEIELDEAIVDPKLDLGKVEKKAKEKEAIETDFLMFRVRTMAKAKEFLSEDQYGKFRKMIELRMRMGGMHGKHGGKHGAGYGGMMGKGGPHGSMGMMGGMGGYDDESDDQ
ncbi:MAG: periplasmic heavy metal sensor [Candidatus Manganitrophaceae bacterium]